MPTRIRMGSALKRDTTSTSRERRTGHERREFVDHATPITTMAMMPTMALAIAGTIDGGRQ